MSREQNEVIVNHLPSLTWNRLGVNAAKAVFDWNDENEGKVSVRGLQSSEITEEKLDSAAADAWIKQYGSGIVRESYVAGKYAIYQKQAFATGMGAGFDEWTAAHRGETTLYTVPAGAKETAPVVITRTMQENASDYREALIHVRAGAEAAFILIDETPEEICETAGGTAALSTRVYLEEGSVLHLMKVNLLGRNYVQLDDTGAYVSDRAHFDFLQMELGGAKTYAGLYVDQAGRKSKFTCNTGYYTDADHLTDLNYVTAQRAKKTVSEILVKGVLADHAQKVFRGTIDFRNGSAGSVGNEREDVLLLDQDVINKTTPVILCEEEDVDGEHGATIGRLDEDMLFYLGTRGISEEEAERIMVRGRLNSIAREIPDEEVRIKLHCRLEKALGAE